MQELKHLYMLSKKDIVYPENFPGGLKGLVKSVLEEYMQQFGEQPQTQELAKGRLLALTSVLCMCIHMTCR